VLTMPRIAWGSQDPWTSPWLRACN